jgi:hypothetical protein
VQHLWVADGAQRDLLPLHDLWKHEWVLLNDGKMPPNHVWVDP